MDIIKPPTIWRAVLCFFIAIHLSLVNISHAVQNPVSADTSIATQSAIIDEKITEPKEHWWEKRQQRADIYYPHNIHKKIMESNGDSCLLCHAFSRNLILDKSLLSDVTEISNEPLEAICHDCHVIEKTAPTECALCHPAPEKVWPEDHNFNYQDNHGHDAKRNLSECEYCHIKTQFCSDCHFKRNTQQRDVHSLGYRFSHGLDAQVKAPECSECHQQRYCRDCHVKP